MLLLGFLCCFLRGLGRRFLRRFLGRFCPLFLFGRLFVDFANKRLVPLDDILLSLGSVALGVIEGFIIGSASGVERAPPTLLALSRQVSVSSQTILHFVAVSVFALH